jgi:hypothetical protein
VPLTIACEPFATVDDFLDCNCACNLTENDADFIEELLDQATDLLALMTAGWMVGRCTRTFRPKAKHECGCRSYMCDSCRMDSLRLPGPFPSVDEVKIDGVVVPANQYALLNGENLIRVSNDPTPPRWPQQQDLWKADSQVGTWSVTVTYGNEVGQVAKNAAVELACELAKACEGRKSALPPNATGTTVGGVSISLRRQAEAIAEGMGVMDLPLVNRFVQSYRPSGTPASSVWSPEIDLYELHVVEPA